MFRVGVKDRKSITAVLTSLESAMLDIIFRAFIRGIIDEEVKYLVLKYMVFSDRFLLGIYIAAEEARRAKLEFQKFMEEERKFKKFNFYKFVV